MASARAPGRKPSPRLRTTSWARQISRSRSKCSNRGFSRPWRRIHDTVNDPPRLTTPRIRGMPLQAGDALPRDPAVDGEEVHPLLGLLLQHPEDLLRVHLRHGPAGRDRLGRRLVERHGPQGDVARGEHAASDLGERPSGGEVHHRVGPGRQRGPQLGHLQFDVHAVPGGADVGVHLGAQPLPDGEGATRRPTPVAAHDRLAPGHRGGEGARVHPLGRGRGLHDVGDPARADRLQQRHPSLLPLRVRARETTRRATSAASPPKTRTIGSFPRSPSS